MNRKVFITGHRGYVGAHLVEVLRDAGYLLGGCDIGLFEGCEWELTSTCTPRVEWSHSCDFAELSPGDLVGYDAIVHLAAISNDPMGELDPSLTRRVNRDAAIALAQKAKAAGVARFLFASSCSIYGRGELIASLGESAEELSATDASYSHGLTECDPVAPLTTYAASKIAAESEILALADSAFTPVSLRFATAYGYSPMLRIDLVVNNLLASGFTTGEVRVMSDGTPWRPLIHCRDMARACLAFLEAPAERISGEVYNVGGNGENYQVRQIADYVAAVLPAARVCYTGEIGQDPRNYRVNFDKLADLLPHFSLSYTLESGIAELHQKFCERGFSLDDFRGEQFVRLRTLMKGNSRLLELCAS